jgi:hypothetical protein
MREIHRLCSEYKEGLSNHADTPRDYRDIRMKIIARLLESKNTNEVRNILKRQPFADSLNYAQTLQYNFASWQTFLINNFLVLISFPISLPLLIIQSWIMRGTPNFLKTDGAILVENILQLCNAVSQEQSKQRPIKKTQNRPTPTLNKNTTSARVIPLVSPNPVNHVPNSSPETSIVVPATSSANPSLKQSPDMATNAINNTLQTINHFSSALFGLMGEKALKTETGSPLIITSRIRPGDEEHYVLDTYCEFKWSSQTPQTLTLSLTPYLYPEMESSTNFVSEQAAQNLPSQNWYARGARLIPSLFRSNPTFQTLMQQGNEQKRVFNLGTAETIYSEALALAQNPAEKILVIEALINTLDSHRELGLKTHDYERYLCYQTSVNFENWTLEEKEKTRNRVAYCENFIAENLAKINENIALLPHNYHATTPSAVAIDRKFHLIYTLLRANCIGEAKDVFDNMPPLTPFIKYAFPGIEATWYQLNGVFHMLDGNGYYTVQMQPRMIPCDDELKQYQLSLYIQDAEIWCATIDREHNIDRFSIDAADLGYPYCCDGYYSLCEALECNIPLSDEIRKKVHHFLADRGYYQYSSLSIPRAEQYFINAYQLLPPESSNAKRFHKEILEPLEALKQAGKHANQSTSNLERRRLAEAFTEKRRKTMETGTITEPVTFTDEDWDTLLNATNRVSITCP